MDVSINTMNQLTNSFGSLNKPFESLYINIEEQNYSIREIDNIFDELNGKVSDMHNGALKNQGAVEDIVKALEVYSENISSVIENTRM
jgi:methyl-accepting chemotaxis protein